MHVLPLAVVEQKAAVLEVSAHVNAVPGEEVPDDGVAQLAQVPGDDQVEVPGAGAGVTEEGGEGVVGGGGHGGAHVVGIGDSLVHDAAAGDVGDIGSGALPVQEGAAGGGGGPLGGGGALVAVGHRHPVLPLGGAVVGGGDGGAAAGKPAVDQHGRQGQGLPHGGAGAVEAEEGDAEVPQAEGGADALVQQVPGQDIVQVLRFQFRFLQGLPQHRLLHGGLRLLPGLLPEEGVGLQPVEVVRQGALAFKFSPDVGEGQHGGGMGQGHGPAAQAFFIHGVAAFSDDFP